jgi:PAS domain S-box-containing protein
MGGPPGGPGVEPDSTAQVVTQSHNLAPRSPDAELRDYRAAFAVARAAMALLGPDGAVLAANGALGTLLGTSPERLTSLDADALLGIDDDPHAQAAFHDVASGRRDSLRCTRRITRQDGGSVRAELTLSRTGTRPLLLTVEDVDERDTLREQLRGGCWPARSPAGTWWPGSAATNSPCCCGSPPAPARPPRWPTRS